MPEATVDSYQDPTVMVHNAVLSGRAGFPEGPLHYRPLCVARTQERCLELGSTLQWVLTNSVEMP